MYLLVPKYRTPNYGCQRFFKTRFQTRPPRKFVHLMKSSTMQMFSPQMIQKLFEKLLAFVVKACHLLGLSP